MPVVTIPFACTPEEVRVLHHLVGREVHTLDLVIRRWGDVASLYWPQLRCLRVDGPVGSAIHAQRFLQRHPQVTEVYHSENIRVRGVPATVDRSVPDRGASE